MLKRNILIVENEYIIALDLKIQLESMEHYDIEIVTRGDEAVNRVLSDKFDLILVDIKLKGELDGIETAKIIKEKRDVALVYVSGNSDLLESERLKKTKPDGILRKPISEFELMEIINKVFRQKISLL